MRLRALLLLIPMLLAPMLLATGAALASPESDSEELIARGVDLRRHGEHGAALELFERAFELRPSARALAQRALAEVSLRRWLAAERHLEAALAHRDSAWIEAKETREVLGKALTNVRLHVGSLRIEGPDGADVSVDDRAVGQLPLPAPIRVAEGETRVVVKVRGKKPSTTIAQVTGGKEVVVRLDIEVERKPPPPVAAIATTAPTLTPVARLPVPAVAITPPVPPPVIVTSKPSPSRPGGFWAGSVLLAAGTGALATGIVWLAVDNEGTCGANSCIHLYDTRTRGWAAVIGGAALAAGGTALLVVSPTKTRSLAVGVSPTGFQAIGRF